MTTFKNQVITGTGCYIPEKVINNESFMNSSFYTAEQQKIEKPSAEVAEKLQTITGIEERRYVNENETTSDIATKAAKLAIAEAGIDIEAIDQIIVAHNFGDVQHGGIQGDVLPALASRVKFNLKINNPDCVAYDIIFGCPGWVQGMIQAVNYMQAGNAKCCLVIGAETLSRVVDPYDRDSMIYADGAGACIIEQKEESEKRGVLSFASRSFTKEECYFLFYGPSNNPVEGRDKKYIKMHGRKIYELGLAQAPLAIQACFDKSGRDIKDLKKIFIHQANEKMDQGIIRRFYRLYNTPAPEDIMPMSIHKLGNSSVATVPTVYDLVRKGNLAGHSVGAGDLVLFASIGAGMNINAITYLI